MGVIQLPDKLQRVIDQHVAEGKAISPAAFLEDAIMRLIDDTAAEDSDLHRTAESGIADIEAGRYTTVATPDDEQRLQDGIMNRLRSSLSNAV